MSADRDVAAGDADRLPANMSLAVRGGFGSRRQGECCGRSGEPGRQCAPGSAKAAIREDERCTHSESDDGDQRGRRKAHGATSDNGWSHSLTTAGYQEPPAAVARVAVVGPWLDRLPGKLHRSEATA